MAVPLISVTDEELDDLRGRLLRTRWPAGWPGAGGWDAGADPRELRRLAGYWAAGYDWRKHEAEINALPSRFADIDGTPVHYLRFDAERPGALPIIVTHGGPDAAAARVDGTRVQRDEVHPHAARRALRRARGAGVAGGRHHGVLPRTAVRRAPARAPLVAGHWDSAD